MWIVQRMRGNFHEMTHEYNAPEEAKKDEASHDAEHVVGIKAVGWRQVGVDRERGSVKKNEENGAAEPTHLHAEITNRLFAMLGREPIRFIGKIDAVGRLVGQDAGSDECNEG